MSPSAFMLVLALWVSRGDTLSDASGATAPSKSREQWPDTLRATESYHLQPFESGCLLLPWSAVFTLLVRMLTDRPTDDSFVKDVSVAPENIPRLLAAHQPGTKSLLLFTEFAWTLMALVGAGVIGARFANQCGGERRQVVDSSYMYYYTKLLTVVEGVTVLALCAFVLAFVANYGLGSSIAKAPEYWEDAIHDLRVYTNLTSEELSSMPRKKSHSHNPSFVELTRLSKSLVNRNRRVSRLRGAAAEREKSLTAKNLADVSLHRLQGKKAPEKKKGTLTEQGIAKMVQRFAWFDEMTGMWGYYAHPILRPIAVYSLAIVAVVAAAGTALGHKNHSEDEDPIKRKPISDIAGRTLLAAACLMLVSCIASLLVIKRSMPHAIAGQCYFCDARRRKDYRQFDYAQDMVWPRSEKDNAFAKMHVGDVLRYCGGEGVSIQFFAKKSSGKKKEAATVGPKLPALLSRHSGARPESAAVYYLCSIIEHYMTSKTLSELVLVPGTSPKKSAVVARQKSGPGMCSPVFGIVNTGISLFCDSFLEYLKSLLLTLFLTVLLFAVGMPTLLMLSKYYLTMLPPPEPPEPPPPPPKRKHKKHKKHRSRSAESGQSSSGDSEGIKHWSASNKLGRLNAGTDVTATGGAAQKGSDGRPKVNEKSNKTDPSGKSRAEKKQNISSLAQRKPQRPEPSRQPDDPSCQPNDPSRQPDDPLRQSDAPYDLFSENLLDMFSEDTASSPIDIETSTGEPAIRVKNVKTRSKPHWCVVDTSTMMIPISQLERARDFLTSSSAASLTPKACNVEVSKISPDPFKDVQPKELISVKSASPVPGQSLPRRGEAAQKPQKLTK